MSTNAATDIAGLVDKASDERVLVEGMSNADYHRINTENFSVSSTQLKDALSDIYVFKAKYITQEQPRVHMDAFDVGEAVHTALLEPNEYAGRIEELPPKAKRTPALKDSGKIVLTHTMVEDAHTAINNIKVSPLAYKPFKDEAGKSEVSAAVRLWVDPTHKQIIYLGDGETVAVLDPKAGWQYAANDAKLADLVAKAATKHRDYLIPVTVKCRADRLWGNKIVDIKTDGTGNVHDPDTIYRSITGKRYALSAALYLDIFNIVDDIHTYDSFMWVYTSTKTKTPATVWASTPEMIQVGRMQYMRALYNVAEQIRTGWKIKETVQEVYPKQWDLDYWESRLKD